MKALPEPLPPTNDDPAIVAARGAKQAYETSVAILRDRVDLAMLYKAQKLKELWQSLVDKLRTLDADLTRRRVEHLEQLRQVVNIGADIPDGTTPADKAVLMQAFNAALDRARSMNADQLRTALNDAERFGDDQAQRAIETAALDIGRVDLLRDHFAATNPERLAAFDRLDDAQRAVQRLRIEDGFAWMAFKAPKPPLEVARIPEFEEAQRVDLASGLRHV